MWRCCFTMFPVRPDYEWIRTTVVHAAVSNWTRRSSGDSISIINCRTTRSSPRFHCLVGDSLFTLSAFRSSLWLWTLCRVSFRSPISFHATMCMLLRHNDLFVCIYCRFSYGTGTWFCCCCIYIYIVSCYICVTFVNIITVDFVWVLTGRKTPVYLLLFSLNLENVRECCKAQWVCVHQRIALYKSYLLLLLSPTVNIASVYCFCFPYLSVLEKLCAFQSQWYIDNWKTCVRFSMIHRQMEKLCTFQCDT